MAYSELIKSFDRIRDYMRQFYVYGFKSRTEYDKKSARSYDNERRRLESWLGDFMRFRQTGEGKNVFLSVDSRSIPANPLYHAFKAKSFTAGDVTFHFYLLDLLHSDEACTAQQLLDRMYEDYLSRFDGQWQPDISTVRKKLKEYVALGIVKAEKRGRELYYSRAADAVPLAQWADALAFYSEADPLGVVGSMLLDKLAQQPGYFRFKHHYMLHALNSRLLLQLLTAIGEGRRVRLQSSGRGRGDGSYWHYVFPLQVFISTQNGRQYLLCYHNRFHELNFFRMDYIQKVELLEQEPEPEIYRSFCRKFKSHLWGASTGSGYHVDHLELTVRFEKHETFILQRLEREKRNGRVELLDEHTCRYITDVYDAAELLPWLRTFIGRIVKLECSDRSVVERFWSDYAQMCRLYGGED